ncbi:hypothetical protein PFISCL1PPCAC_19205, partial [Pristionchus fissidentatus]
ELQFPFFSSEAVKWNAEQSHVVYFNRPTDCVRDLEAEKWTGFIEEPELRCLSTGNSTARVLVMGNSYAYRAFPVLHRIFNGRYAQMRLFTRSSTVFLTKDSWSSLYVSKAQIVLEKFRPDITFLIEKDFGKLSTSFSRAVEDDPITKEMIAAIDILSNYSGTVVVDRQYYQPHINAGAAYTIHKRILQG